MATKLSRRVRAFLNGTVTTEATPGHLSELASKTLRATHDKYLVPHTMDMQIEIRTASTRKTSLALFAIMGIAFTAFGYMS